MKCLFCYVQILFISILAAIALSELPQGSSTCEASPEEKECRNENADGGHLREAIHLITREELGSKTGENDSEIWLSILGEVFDVSEGKSFYGKGMSYGGLAGTDCTVCYVSGIFTAEEAAKDTDEISDAMINGVVEWLSFYENHKSYKFIGYLIDPRFYDENGEPTANLVGVRKRISLAKK